MNIHTKKIFLLLFNALLLVKVYSLEVSNTTLNTTFKVESIVIEGLQRIESATVFSYLPININDTLTPDKSDEIITKLYSLGFFKDIRLDRAQNTLIISVWERPIIADITVTGSHEFDHDKLLESLKAHSLSEGKIFDQSVLDQAVLGLKSEYYNRGFYLVNINPKVVELKRNRLSINIDIKEGPPSKIKAITFIGNKVFSKKTLQEQIFLNTGNLLSWWTKDNRYSGELLGRDLEKVRAYYLDRGYIDFKINSVVVQLDSTKTKVYVIVNLSEGLPYKVKEVKLAGNTQEVDINELKKLVRLSPGDIANAAKLNDTIEAIKSRLGNYGYAFSEVNPIVDANSKTHLISYTLFINPQKKFYVRKINISGNEKTRDTVIRRELRQNEASVYNLSALKRSRERLFGSINSFESVAITPTLVKGTNDQLDIDVKVKEKDTGAIQLGVGYMQGTGPFVNGSVTQSNLLGSGKSLAFTGSTSFLNQSLALSFTDPFFLSNGTSLGYDLYNNKYTPNNPNLDLSPYSINTLGARVRSSVPVSEYDSINFALGVENNQINLSGNNVPLRFTQFTQFFGNSIYSIPFSVGWGRNTTDSLLWPTRGARFSETIDMTLPGVGAEYYRFTSKNDWFIPLFKDFVWKVDTQLGLINSYASTSMVPFYQNYYMGGIGSVRGYAPNTIGPKDVDGYQLGGTRELLLSNEIFFPMPGLRDDHSVRLSVFYDIGTLWGGNSFDLTPSQVLRAGYGVGLTWISPIGPLTFSYAWPMFNKPNDNTMNFSFMIGTSF